MVDSLETLYPVCIRHMKWAPCLVKSDLEHECRVISTPGRKMTEANLLIRGWHNGILSRSKIEDSINHELFNYEVVDWGV